MTLKRINIIESASYSRKLTKLEVRLVRTTRNKVRIFRKNPRSKILKNHALKGKMRGKHAFSINNDIRIVYKWQNKNTVRFLAIGKHSEVYN